MPDISMCHGMPGGIECPERGSCHRYTATPSPFRQAYALPAHDPRAEKCHLYWPTDRERRATAAYWLTRGLRALAGIEPMHTKRRN